MINFHKFFTENPEFNTHDFLKFKEGFEDATNANNDFSEKMEAEYIFGKWKVKNSFHFPDNYDFPPLGKELSPLDKHWNSVLKRSDIYLLADEKKNIYISAKGFDTIPVPEFIIKKFEGIKKTAKSLTGLIIDECINSGVFYAPCDELIYNINISG